MNRWWSRAATALLLLTLVVIAALTVAWAMLPLDGTTITVDGETFSLGSLSGGQIVAAFAIAIIATIVALLVAAFAIVVSLAVAVFGAGIGILAAAASLALVASPLLLIGWLVWRAFRRPRPASTTAPAA
ncbi:MAG TPA: hypothetical protein VGH48_12040 [Caldimonas sp.]|jgi:hypothetical protein